MWGMLKRILRLSIIAGAFLLPGCLSVPEWRVFEKEVPEPTTVQPETLEAWRQAADFAERKVEEPAEATYVLDALTSSMGAPERPTDDYEAIVQANTEAYRSYQAELRKINDFLRDYQGKEIEGTGLNLAAPLGGIGLIGIIAACVFIPGFATFLFWIIKRVWSNTRGALSATVNAIEQFKQERPDEAALLLQNLSSKMDAAHKAVVRKIRP